ncbi:MAG: hypothetical protein ACI8RZ_003612 [Myxococcota bacterium]|jgi:hypothetical protein
MFPLVLPLLLGCSSETARPSTDDTDIDPTLDSDGDGITDVVELAEETDPHDPASATAWHPEWTDRPRLLTDAAGLERLQEALTDKDEPTVTLSARLVDRCAATPAKDDETLASATGNGNIALACAVVYLGGDAKAGMKSAEILATFPTEVSIGLEDVFYTDLRAGQGVLQGIRAWDLLLAIGYPEGYDADDAGERLHALGDSLWTFYVEDYPQWLDYAQNNHNTKFASMLGALGMGAWDDPRSARYVNFAASELPRFRDYLLTDDGGYGEGPSYLVYAMESELPFMVALDRWLGDETMLVRHTCVHDPDPDCTETLIEHGSPLRDERICTAFDRFVEQMMPAGYAPNTDDSNLATAHLGLVAGLCGSPYAAWGWEFQATEYDASGSVDVTADTLLAWPDAPVGSAPPIEPILRADAGWAVLRSGWERDSAYALLVAENGLARESGGGHEHPDNLSFLWATGGHYLLLDSGYGNWSGRGEVSQAEAHSLFLVGGEGPTTDDDAWIDDAWSEGDLQIARGHTTYRGLVWQRTLVLVGETALILWDETAPESGAIDLALQLQGPSTGMSLDGGIARWDLHDQTLQVALIAEQTPTLDSRTEQHAFHYATYEEHDVLQASATIDGETRWLTVAWLGDPDQTLSVDGETIRWPTGSATLSGTVISGESKITL